MNRPSKLVIACPKKKRPWAGGNGGEVMIGLFFFYFLLEKTEDSENTEAPPS